VSRSISQSRTRRRSSLSRTVSCNLLAIPIWRNDGYQEKEQPEKVEKQGQVVTRIISQYDQHNPIRVRLPPHFTIPCQEGRSWCTDDRVFHWTKNLPQYLLQYWVRCQHNVQGNIWILIWWWIFVPL
jgi:hypothetical protein